MTMVSSSAAITNMSFFRLCTRPENIYLSALVLPSRRYLSCNSHNGLVQQHGRGTFHLPLLRAQSSTIAVSDYIPEAQFYKVEAILRPWRVTHVSSALLKMGIRGVTVSDVRGFGAQGGMTERQAGSEFSEDNFVAKVKMEIVVSKDQVEAVIEQIIEVARTGEIGDGKIFVVPVADVVRVRTGERGESAERMMGGRADMYSMESPA